MPPTRPPTRNRRVVVLGIVLVLFGATFAWLPIATIPIGTQTLQSGVWAHFEVPRGATLTGLAVQLVVNWSGDSCQCTSSCDLAPATNPPFALSLVDCGTATCGRLPPPSPSRPGTYGPCAGDASLTATPGHFYAIAMTDPSPIGQERPVTLSYLGPILSGWLGVASALSGVATLLYEFRLPKEPRPPRDGF